MVILGVEVRAAADDRDVGVGVEAGGWGPARPRTSRCFVGLRGGDAFLPPAMIWAIIGAMELIARHLHVAMAPERGSLRAYCETGRDTPWKEVQGASSKDGG